MRTKCAAILGLLTAVAAAGCAVGPDFETPPAPTVDRYTPQASSAQTSSVDAEGVQVQDLKYGAELPAQWWELFKSPQLNQLVGQALRNSPTLHSAQAALRSAKERVNAASGSLYPSLDATGSASRQQGQFGGFNAQGAAPFYDVRSASMQVSYLLDPWGREQRQREALAAEAEYSRYQVEATYLALTSNVVITALQSASLQAQLQATQDIILNQRRQLILTQHQFETGAVSRADVLAAQTQLASTETTLPALQQAQSQAQTQLATLLGLYPSQLEPVELDLAALTLPQDLPVSLPSVLTRQRPDVQAQGALLHAASARIGVATADMLPRLTLSAAYGSYSFGGSQLLRSTSDMWTAVGGITLPVFHAGSFAARRRAAIADYQFTLGRYREVVLHAFADVADALSALKTGAEAVDSHSRALDAAQQTLALVQQQYAAGLVPQAALLIAESEHRQSRIGYVRASANRYQDTAALFVALGGGWWNRAHDATGAMTSSDMHQ